MTRGGKLLFLYKRPGQRVIVDASGRMIVRPSHMEASVQQSAAGQSCIDPPVLFWALPQLQAKAFVLVSHAPLYPDQRRLFGRLASLGCG